MNDIEQANSAIQSEEHHGGQQKFRRAERFPDLGRVRETVEVHFPTAWPATEASLSAIATLLLKDNYNPTALILEGRASSIKTTVLDFFAQAGQLVYRSDKFTPKAFVSHHAAAKKESLAKVDLLPRIKHRVMVTPELAPVFRAREEELIDNFTILTRVLDGQGLTTDSGTHGRRGYEGDHLFTWLGATTPLPPRTWRVMAQLGSRLYFWPMPGDEPTDQELDEAITGEMSYREKLEACQEVVGEFVAELFGWYGGVRSAEWDRLATPKVLLGNLRDMSRMVCRLRGVVSIWREAKDGELTHSPANIELPYRAGAIFFNIAR
ncbi:MAG: hypothetical protein QGI09_09565, partial [Dehalococcoidia bacterium]|nr:hypothetical protein [Dehalococcoidia bacterium]